jgi:hypothetical protein
MKITVFILLFLVHVKVTLSQYSYDSITFENPTDKILIDTSANNLWQIGTPQKTFFNAANTGNKAIMTDTLINYPVNNTSSFIYVIRNPYTMTCFTRMQFWHKYDMDSASDQGKIDASYDGGNSWIAVQDTFGGGPMGFFYWEGDYHAVNHLYTPHPVITTGRSDGWILSSFIWEWFMLVDNDTIIINPDSLMIRFTFHSDSILEEKEGWMIDDIITSSAWWELCSNTNELPDSPDFSIVPNPIMECANIRFNGLINAWLEVFDITGCLRIKVGNISGNNYLFSRNGLGAGFYFIRITTNRGISSTKKIMIRD